MSIFYTKRGSNRGFTIVELLVVIVVIGILAAITIVAFNGVSQRAKEGTMISDLKGAAKQLSMYRVDNSAYPTSNDCSGGQSPVPPKICLKSSGSNIYSSYTVDTSTPGNPHYTLVETNGSTAFYVTDIQNPGRYSVISTTGGVITTSGGQTIHTFTASGTFTVSGGTLSSVSVLVIGGGGGGGLVNHNGPANSGEAGGGGGGQFMALTGLSVSGSTSTTIGLGGVPGANGSTSTFGTYIAIGGGAGGPSDGVGKNGASGGGGGEGGQAGGIGTAGFNGGTGFNGGVCGGTPSGGGGAGAIGGGGGSCIGGVGGIGKSSSISGLSICYAGGGSAEGLGNGCGGGNGPNSGPPAAAGSPNTGGGGGMSMNGGSGIIIISYPTP